MQPVLRANVRRAPRAQARAQIIVSLVAVVGRQSDDDKPTDIVVVVKGPVQSILVREKQKLGGLMWVNASRLRYRSAPG